MLSFQVELKSDKLSLPIQETTLIVAQDQDGYDYMLKFEPNVNANNFGYM